MTGADIFGLGIAAFVAGSPIVAARCLYGKWGFCFPKDDDA